MSISRCIRLVEDFHELAKRSPGPVEYSASFGDGQHLVVSALIHGDEVGTLQALLRWMKKFDEGLRVPFKVSFFLGNVPAAIEGRRYLESDLNRSFGKIHSASTLEEKRARELAPLILSAGLYVDLHQTITPSRESFHVFAFDEKSYRWARLIGKPKKFITHSVSRSFSDGDVTSDEYAQSAGVPALSVEFFQKGFTKIADESAQEFLDAVFQAFERYAGRDQELTQESERQAELDIWTIKTRFELGDKPVRLVPGLENLMPVEPSQVLGHFDDATELKAGSSGILLFPKYPSAENPGPTITGALFLIAEQGKPVN